MGSGAKWKTVEGWVVNPVNTRGLGGDFILGNLSSDIANWEDAADGVIGNGTGADILGNGTSTEAVLAADLYESVCGEETMYGYSTNGETKKQTLNSGDIAGVNKLY